MATEKPLCPAPPPGDWHLRDAHALAREHGVDPAHGLPAHEVSQRSLRHGPNELRTRASRSLWALLIDQFSDFMILVLLAAAVISGVIGDLVDTLVILVIVLLNAVIGLVQAWRADQALAALQKLAAAQATVLRDGRVQQVPAHALVPGDIVLLEAGNQIPADLRLLEIAQLKVDESALTGESVTVVKHAKTLAGEVHALGDRLNMAFKGTTATHGRGCGLVVATGMATELGKVAGLLDQDSERSTPLQRRLAAFGKRVALAVLAICVVIFMVGVLRGESPLHMVLVAISLAVAAIPEALPAVVTVLLALGARKMVNINALIRRLPSVETLGSVTFICSDKTGTLTQNRMRTECLVSAGAPAWTPGAAPPGPAHAELLRAAALCNDARPGPEGQWQGDPTETALSETAAAAGLEQAALQAQWPRVQEHPFDAERKRMTTFHASTPAPVAYAKGGQENAHATVSPANKSGPEHMAHTDRDKDSAPEPVAHLQERKESSSAHVAYTKGAPESVLALCTSQWREGGPAPIDRAAWLAQAEELAAQGLRVLAVARRAHAQLPPADAAAEAVERDLSLIGLIGLIDPPRPEAAGAVGECVAAGIVPVMITGDHPATARAIALRLGLVSDAQAPVLTGADLATMDEATLRERVQRVRIYARVDPAQKIRIVQALQAQGEFVAMTGDGVNDAPALKRADIGVAMGKGGTDVAREAASLVLLDDNFATIVKAVREGRRIYDNIRKFVRYAMTGNSGEIWVIFLAPLLMLPIPLLPIHILWVNLVTDGLPGLALAAEPAERGVMRRPPRPPGESLFAHGMWQHILGIGLLLGALCLGVQAWAISTGHAHWQTMVFTTLTLGQMAHLMAIRSETDPLWRLRSNHPLLGAVLLTFVLQMATIYLPWLNPIFRTEPLSLAELGICLAAACVVYVAVETEKAWRRGRTPLGICAPGHTPDGASADAP